MFDAPKYFHVGADETMQLGACPTCKAHVAEHGIADLYRGHMDRIIEIVHAQGSRPLLWADMFLSHPESLQGLSQDILLCDWAYERDNDATEVFLFEHGKFSVESAPDSAINAFGDRLYRAGSNRSQLNPWVAAEHLAAAGFDLLLCPASSHHGDPVYVARTKMHMRNIGDTLHCAERLNVRGTILTSWTWHLFSWELQRHLIAYYREVANGSQRSHDAFLNAYGQERLGMTAVSFSQICDRLEHPCPLLDVNQLGFFKGCIHRKSDPVGDLILGLKQDGKLKAMCEQAKEASRAFEHAQHLLRTVEVQSEELAAWQLAAESMAARAHSAHYLLQRALAESVTEDAQALVACEEALRARQLSEFLKNVLPHRAEEMVSCQFDRVIQALRS